MLASIRKLLAAPVFPGDEEKTRVAGLLNTILLLIIALVTVFSISALVLTPDLSRVLLELFLLLFSIGLLVLMRRGSVRLAGIILTSIIWLAVSYGTYLSGGFRGSNMASYLGIIFIAGLLLDTWAALAFGVLSIGFTWLLLYGDGQPWLPAAAPYITVNTFWSEFSAVVIGVVGLLALTMNSLHSALNRARRNERELAEKMVEVEKLAREAQEADLFKTRLIARVGHELRTPLGAISGMTEILQQGSHGSLNGKQNELVDRILVNCQTLNTTFSELLEQADIHARNIEVKQESFSPAKLLDRIEDGFGKLAEQKGLEFYLHIAPDLPSQLVGDPGKIEQILINLILNAIKFTEKGSIAVALDRLDPGEWTVRVTDSGIGIPEDQQEKIFEPFRQVDESRTRKYGGLGLGLTIVRQLVTAMNGHVTLESKPGRGTAITVTLPLVEPIIEAAQ